MTSPVPGGRRRIDLVLSVDFLEDLETATLDDVRQRRREAEQEDADLSYIRRMLQGRMDILRAELSRRSNGGDDKLVDHLSRILSDVGRADHGLGRYLTVEPSRVDEHRRAVEQVIADVGVSDVEGHSDDEVRAALARVEEFERGVSEDRQAVQKVMDALTAEVTRRYRTGAASVEDLLAER
ncbi:MAG: hypothetical protein QOJ90_1814 [Actinomycetota bacterium]|jgi:hypothetical protein|nr:hypothetical protein [Actinomycetota bacterium]MDQ1642463.1 hypothetical protein [Actinomycetota bacterium]